ncbi:MAG: M20/M25/M40 family metallo-hydrolase [Verrucomicrobia bacterium]|nr:M20/M25/M40 family metallo-hydrolase [Verrucomicrobiota bacterium]
MQDEQQFSALLSQLSGYRSQLSGLRELVLANAIMLGEIPAPLFGEDKATAFIRDRFMESALEHISLDEVGNVSAVLPGSGGGGTILVAAHVDKVWDGSIDHSVTVSPELLKGPGIADNSIGVAAMVSLPEILRHLGIQLKSDLILLGTTRSMGRGDLAGLRFFVENVQRTPDCAVCVEGVQLGRLSYSSLGMVRGDIYVRTPEERDWLSYNNKGAIVALNRIIDRILAIETPRQPETSIILGSVMAGTAYNVPPTKATLRFEVRSEQRGMVARIVDRITEIIEQINAEDGVHAELSVIARRKPGGIEFSHPLVKSTRKIMERLAIKPKVAPSTSELSTFVDKGISAITLGITRGEGKHSLDECAAIEPIFYRFDPAGGCSSGNRWRIGQ